MEMFRKRKKVCQMCSGRDVKFTDIDTIKKYINEKGKIVPRRVTGTCAKHQRHIANEIKKARIMALIPFVR